MEMKFSKRDEIVVSQTRSDLQSAILQSANTLDRFVSQFLDHQRECTDFLVTAAVPNDGHFIPIGIQVTDVNGCGEFTGLAIENDLKGTRICECKFSSSVILDWRYVDTYLLKGGHLYRALLKNVPKAIARDLADEASFFFEYPVEFDKHNIKFLRSVLRGDERSIREMLSENLEFWTVERLLPSFIEGRIELGNKTNLDFLAAKGCKEAVSSVLASYHIPESFLKSMLFNAASEGKSEVVMCICQEHRYLLQSRDELGDSALHLAVRSGNVDSVRFLVQEKNLVNSKDANGHSPLFYASSEIVANVLLSNGADDMITSDAGTTLYEYLCEVGRMSLASSIALARGRTFKILRGRYPSNAQEILDLGAKTILSLIQDGKIIDDSGLAAAINRTYGAVLPVKFL